MSTPPLREEDNLQLRLSADPSMVPCYPAQTPDSASVWAAQSGWPPAVTSYSGSGDVPTYDVYDVMQPSTMTMSSATPAWSTGWAAANMGYDYSGYGFHQNYGTPPREVYAYANTTSLPEANTLLVTSKTLSPSGSISTSSTLSAALSTPKKRSSTKSLPDGNALSSSPSVPSDLYASPSNSAEPYMSTGLAAFSYEPNTYHSRLPVEAYGVTYSDEPLPLATMSASAPASVPRTTVASPPPTTPIRSHPPQRSSAENVTPAPVQTAGGSTSKRARTASSTSNTSTTNPPPTAGVPVAPLTTAPLTRRSPLRTLVTPAEAIMMKPPAASSSSGGKRVHGCWMCHKAFDRPSTLTKHLLVHTREKAHECPHCQRRFGILSNMHRHMRRCKRRPDASAPTDMGSNDADASGRRRTRARSEDVVRDTGRGHESTDSDEENQDYSAQPVTSAAGAPSGDGDQSHRPKRRRRAASATRWVPASLANFDLSPYERTAPMPLPPVRPYEISVDQLVAQLSLSGNGSPPNGAVDLDTDTAAAAAGIVIERGEHGRSIVVEERDSFDEDVHPTPYHPNGWRGRLPGPRGSRSQDEVNIAQYGVRPGRRTVLA